MPIFEVTDPKSGRIVELESQDNTPPTEQELEQVFSSNGGQSSDNQFLSENPILDKKSPLSNTERIKLGALNDTDREKYLIKQYPVVQKLDNGKFAVGQTPAELSPIDPEGMFNDILGDLSDVASEIPVIAGQILGTFAGASVGGVPGGIAGAGIGAGVGEVVRKGLIQSTGLSSEDAGQMAADVAVSSLFGSLGEGISQGASYAVKSGRRVLAPKLSNMLNQGASKESMLEKVSPDNTRFAQTTSKIFRYLANVPEDSTNTFFRYGMKEMNNPIHFDPKQSLNLVDDMVEKLDIANKKLGQNVANQTDNLVATAKRYGSDAKIKVDDLHELLKKSAQDIGIIDDFGKINKNYPNEKDISPIIKLLDDFKGGNVDVKKAVQISRSWSQKFEGMNLQVQAIFGKILNGYDELESNGLRNRVSALASKFGLEDYAQANQKFSRLMKLQDRLSQLDTKNPGKIENFINRLENIGNVEKRDLVSMQNIIGGDFVKRWELWNAAQDFNKSNLNVLRFGAIAAAIASATGFETKESKAGTLIGAGLLGTPAGLKTVIRVLNRAGTPINKKVLENIGRKTAESTNAVNPAARAIVSRLLAESSNLKPREDNGKNQPANKNNSNKMK